MVGKRDKVVAVTWNSMDREELHQMNSMAEFVASLPNRIPQLRIMVTPFCNYECFYCRPGGEGYYNNLNELLNIDEIVSIIRIASQTGYRYIKFTGGEPLLRKDIVHLVEAIKHLSIVDIQLATNGFFLNKKAEALKSAGLSSITVSLDTPNPFRYKQITGSKGNIDIVIQGMRICKNIGLPVRINTVVTKKNEQDIPLLIQLCEEVGASLKLIDFMNIGGNFRLWKENFVDLRKWREYFEKRALKKGYEAAPGGMGAPLREYILSNGIRVVIRDATEGTDYHSLCKECELFPCQDAMISLRITHDGKLKRCLLRNDNLIDIIRPLKKRNYQEVQRKLREQFEILSNSIFYPNAWSLEVEKEKWKRRSP